MKLAITTNGLEIICIVGALAAFACSLLGRLVIAAFALFLTELSYINVSKQRKTAQLGDLSIFVSNMLLNYSEGKSTISIIKESLDQRFAFYKDMQKAIKVYMLTGDARKAFAWAGTYPVLYREVFFALAGALESGASVLGPMKEIMGSIESANAIKSKSIGSMSNAMSIVGIGSVVFFPVFAGISYYIMGFSASINGAMPIGQAAYMFIIMFYIMEISLHNNRGRLDKLSMSSIAASIALGSFLFKASYILALNGIRW